MSVEVTVLKFQPKGSMCAVCAHKNECCKDYNFYEMPVIEHYRNGDERIMIVKCLKFERLQ